MKKKEKIKLQRRMLKIQASSVQAMVRRCDELYDEIRVVKSKAFDMLAERG